jgi:hypothetical protein
MTQPESSHAAKYLWLFGFLFAVSFTFIIWLTGPYLQPFLVTLLPDQGAAWYYWKLPLRDFMTMFIVWTFYLAHQFSIWAAIHWARRNLVEFRTTPAPGLTKYNYAALIITLSFVVLHLLQTHVWFDGLAQDVPIWTSQGSVIVLLSMILVIENPRRGLFMGRKAGKPFTAQASAFLRRNHPYIVSWALVYTFWFHPMTYDPQLLSGFFYMFLLFTQVILAYTTVHVDKRWIITLESYVAIHALIVAVYNTTYHGSPDMWPMFFAGFAFMFVFTYMYALKVRKGVLGLITAAYVVFLVWLYTPTPLGFGRDISYLFRLEFLWIPIVLYGLSAVFALLAYLYVRGKTPPDNAVS